MKKETGIQMAGVRPLLLPRIMIGMSALLVLIGIGLYSQYVRYYERQLTANHDSAALLYRQSIQNYQATLGATLSFLIGDGRVAAMLESKDAAGLYAVFNDSYEQVRQTQSVKQMLFSDADRRVIVRMHAPAVKDAELIRPIYDEALLSKGMVAGLDAGFHGELILRMVTPVYRNETLVGYVEAAMEIQPVVDAAQRLQQLDLAFALKRERLTYTRVEQRKEPSERGFWLEAGADYLVYSTLSTMDQGFAGHLVRHVENSSRPAGDEGDGRFSLFRDNSYYVANTIDLNDSLGFHLGELFIIENATYLWSEYIIMALLLLGAGLGIILVSRHIIGAGLDRTDARIQSMMDRIARTELIFENVFNESETGFILLSRTTGNILRANSSALRLFGAADAGDIRLFALHELPEDDPMQIQWMASGAGSPLMAIEGERDTVYCESDRFLIGEHENLHCMAVRDVTRVIRLQNESRTYIEYLQRIIDQLPGVVCIKDSDLRLTLFNAAFKRLFGSGEDVLGRMYYAEWMGDTMDKVLEFDRKVLEHQEPISAEVELTPPEGGILTYLVSKRVIQGKNGNPQVLSVGTDITERIRVEKQLISLREKAEAANIAKSEFLARMSHEIRTPMNAILGMTYLAMAKDPDETRRGQLGKIRNAAGDLLGIISDILDYSALESGAMRLKREPFSMNALLNEVGGLGAALLEDKPVTFELLAPDFDATFIGDADRLRQALGNLLDNAAKFTDEGVVRLVCEAQSDDGRAVHLYFAVEDTGIGISSDDMDAIFTGFEQADGGSSRRYGGTGLGLSISRQLIRLMGGEVGIRSSVDVGSSFFFSLTLEKGGALEVSGSDGKSAECRENRLPETPVMQRAASESPEAARTACLPGAGREDARAGLQEARPRVLVVEDNPINQEIIAELLRDQGLDVHTVENGREALDIIEREPFDLIFMDLQMPVMDGLAATRAIRALPDSVLSHLPIVALTANAMEQDKAQCREAGMDDFISKPIDVPELLSKLERWLGEGGEPERPLLAV